MRYLPGSHVIVVLPAAQDLSIELLMRSHRANALFIGDGYMDSFVSSVWRPVLSKQIAQLRAGQRLLVDRAALQIAATLRADPSLDPIAHPVGAGAAQEEWILREIGRRFDLKPIDEDPDGLVVAELAARPLTS